MIFYFKSQLRSLELIDVNSLLPNQRPGERYRFQRVTEIQRLQDALRNKFASYYIREQILESEMNGIREKEVASGIKDKLQVYKTCLHNDQEAMRRKTMKVIQTVKGYFQETGKLN